MAKGLNTILGTILLIGIAIGAGASIFNITNQFSIVGFSKTEYNVLDASLTKSTDNQCFLSVKLMNTGTETIARTEIEVSTDKNGTLTIPDSELPANISKSIDPGDTITFDSTVFTNSTGVLLFFDNCAAWKNCQTYTMDVLGNAVDSSKTAVSHILQCKESDRI
ncbi:MAG: hypothetical protein ACRD5H_08005 [Nitrososphaerales archaeon]